MNNTRRRQLNEETIEEETSGGSHDAQNESTSNPGRNSPTRLVPISMWLHRYYCMRAESPMSSSLLPSATTTSSLHAQSSSSSTTTSSTSLSAQVIQESGVASTSPSAISISNNPENSRLLNILDTIDLAEGLLQKHDGRDKNIINPKKTNNGENNNNRNSNNDNNNANDGNL